MHFAAFVLGWVLVGQTTATAVAEPPAAVPAAARPRPSPPDIVAQLLTLPPESTLAGRPLTIATALASTQDRRQQLELVHAYWRLAEAVADYNFSLAQSGQLAQLQAGAEEAAELHLAQATATAALHEAEADVVAAQHELAGLMLLAGDAPLPLPGNRPHVGPYRTYFKELFAGRPAPPRARLLDGTLPLRSRVIDARAAALQAAEDALAAATRGRASGHGPLAPLVAALDALHQQQRAMMASVCRYNHDIADYALSVAEPGTNEEALAAMLVRTARQPGQPPASTIDRGVRPASATEPIPPPGMRWNNQPTLAPPRVMPPGIPSNEPTPVPPGNVPASSGRKIEPVLPPLPDSPPAKDGNEPTSLLRRPIVPLDHQDTQPPPTLPPQQQ